MEEGEQISVGIMAEEDGKEKIVEQYCSFCGKRETEVKKSLKVQPILISVITASFYAMISTWQIYINTAGELKPNRAK